MKSLVLAALLASAYCGAVAASDSLVLPTIPELREQIKNVKQGLGSDKSLSEDKRREVGDAIARIESRIGDDVNTYASLNAEQQTEMVNDVALIRSVMTTDEDRMVCKRERKVGSHRIDSVCKTASEWERLKAEAEKNLQMQSQRACTGFGCT